MNNLQKKSRSKWLRQKSAATNLSTEFDKVKSSPLPYIEEAFVAKYDSEIKEHSSKDGEDSSCGSIERSELPLHLGRSRLFSDGRARVSDVERNFLPPSIPLMKSWSVASVLLNDPIIRQFYVQCIGKIDRTIPRSRKLKSQPRQGSFYTLSLPSCAPQITQTRKYESLKILHSSRGKFCQSPENN